MKLRTSIVTLAVLALTACSGGGSTPATPAKNPSSILVTTTVAGVATSGISVTLSTSLVDNVPPTDSIVQTLSSGSNGTTGEITFDTGVPMTGKLCLSATYVIGTQSQTLAGCHSQPYPSSATLNFTI